MSAKNKLSTMVREIVDKETRDFLQELPVLLRAKLNSASLAIIGLDQHWGRDNIKINENGSAFFSSLLRSEVQEECAKLTHRVSKAALKLMTERRLNQLTDSLADHYYYELKKRVEKQLDLMAEQHSKLVCKKIEEQFNAEALLKNLDLNDPKSFSGQLGEFVLEAIAEDLATGKDKTLKLV